MVKREDEGRVWGQKIVQKSQDVEKFEGYKGFWQRVSEEGRTGALTKKGVETVKKALGCKEKRLIHPETGFEKCGLVLGITTIPPHGTNLLQRHNCWEVFYILRGKGKFLIEGKEFWAEKGDGVNIPPDSVHKAFNESDKPFEYLYVCSPPLIGMQEDIETARKYGYIAALEEGWAE